MSGCTIKMEVRHFIIIIFIAASSSAYSQSNPGTWYIYNGSFFTNPSTELFFETQFRFRSLASNKEEVFFRPIYVHHFSKIWNAGLGYSYGINFNDAQSTNNEKSSHEHRIILQATLNTPIQRTNLQHRFRLEQRWITTTNPEVTSTKQRLRYRIQATIPIGSTMIEKGVFFLNFYNELFIGIEDEVLFDQNRLYGAAGYQFTASTNMQVGYLFQSRRNENLHRLQFFVTQKLFFFK